MSGDEIAKKFLEEKDEVLFYVSFLNARIHETLEKHDVVTALSNLQRLGISHDIPLAEVSQDAEIIDTELLIYLRDLIRENYQKMLELLNATVEEHQLLKEQIEKDDSSQYVRDRVLLYFEARLKRKQNRTIEEARNLTLNYIEKENKAFRRQFYTVRMVDYAENKIRAKRTSYRRWQIENILYTYRQSELVLKFRLDQGVISVFRQAFILLMAVFDATVFDLVREALEKDFFKLIPTFSKGTDDKFAFKQFRDYASFDEMKASLIEQQLSGMYVKNVLKLLNDDLKVLLVSSSNENTYRFIDLLEMLNRRNIHLHNRGVVDEKYRQLNLYNFDLNEPAPIDQAYFDRATQICTFTIESIARWIDSLPNTPQA